MSSRGALSSSYNPYAPRRRPPREGPARTTITPVHSPRRLWAPAAEPENPGINLGMAVVKDVSRWEFRIAWKHQPSAKHRRVVNNPLSGIHGASFPVSAVIGFFLSLGGVDETPGGDNAECLATWFRNMGTRHDDKLGRNPSRPSLASTFGNQNKGSGQKDPYFAVTTS